jgi:hypothetical protein
MSTGLKALGIVGVGAVLALGISAPETPPSTASTKNSVIAPNTKEIKPITKPTTVTPVTESVKKVVPKPVVTKSKPKSKPKPKPTSSCHPSYSGCLKMNAGDYDCAGGSGNGPNYTGAVQVYGSDPFGLDRDNDGWGCE